MTEKLLDGAEMAILINRFEGIARKMTNTLYRTGRSGVLNRARDFSCCIVTHDCHLLAAAEQSADSCSSRPEPHGGGHETIPSDAQARRRLPS